MRERIERTTKAAFTLVELLTVIAIISLLIGILIPSLSRARDQAKNVKSSASIKGIGEGLELFKTENEKHFRATNGYPPSLMAEDQAYADEQPNTCGAQWVVRYLLGKDLLGYAPWWNRGEFKDGTYTSKIYRERNPTDTGIEVGWYTPGASDFVEERLPTYLDPDAMEIKRTDVLCDELNRSTAENDMTAYQAPVFVDAFGAPILYYVANPAVANTVGGNMASYHNNLLVDYNPGNASMPSVGVYSIEDNASITGRCMIGGDCDTPAIDMNGRNSEGHSLGKFSDLSGSNPSIYENSFQGFIMNDQVGDVLRNDNGSINVGYMQPYRKNSFLLISPGKDMEYGTQDDVTNFK